MGIFQGLPGPGVCPGGASRPGYLWGPAPGGAAAPDNLTGPGPGGVSAPAKLSGPAPAGAAAPAKLPGPAPAGAAPRPAPAVFLSLFFPIQMLFYILNVFDFVIKKTRY